MNTRSAARTRMAGGRGATTVPPVVVKPMTAQVRPMGTVKPRQAGGEEAHGPQMRPRRAGVACAAQPQSAGVATAIRDDHRAKQLVETAEQFLHAWTRCVKEGPSEDAMMKLGFMVDDAVALEERDLGNVHTAKGIDGLKQWLQRLSTRYATKGHEVLLIAANDVDDEVYVLLEYQHEDKNGGHSHHDYKVIKLEILIDEANRRVTDVQQYGQLEPAHLRSAANRTDVGRASFPINLLRGGKGPDTQVARDIAEKWAAARSSAAADASAVAPLMDTTSFQLWDTYHVLPDPSGGGSGSGSQQAVAFSWQQVQDTVKASKAAYDQEFKLLDNAVSTSTNAGFTHWRAHYKPRSATGEPFDIEGVQVDIYTPDGNKLAGAWVFRDPTPAEKIQLQNA